MSMMGDLQLQVFDRMEQMLALGMFPRAGYRIHIKDVRTATGSKTINYRLQAMDLEYFKQHLCAEAPLKGKRVVCLVSPDRILGYGKYVDDRVPPLGVSPLVDKFSKAKVSIPQILLDDNHAVWGCECWYFAEGRSPEIMKGDHEKVSICDVRSGLVE